MKNLSSQKSLSTLFTKTQSQNLSLSLLHFLTIYLVLFCQTSLGRYLPRHHKNYRVTIENIKQNIELCKSLGGMIRCSHSNCRCTKLIFNFSIASLEHPENGTQNPDKTKNKTAKLEEIRNSGNPDSYRNSDSSRKRKYSSSESPKLPNNAFSADFSEFKSRDYDSLMDELVNRSHHRKKPKTQI